MRISDWSSDRVLFRSPAASARRRSCTMSAPPFQGRGRGGCATRSGALVAMCLHLQRPRVERLAIEPESLRDLARGFRGGQARQPFGERGAGILGRGGRPLAPRRSGDRLVGEGGGSYVWVWGWSV